MLRIYYNHTFETDFVHHAQTFLGFMRRNHHQSSRRNKIVSKLVTSTSASSIAPLLAIQNAQRIFWREASKGISHVVIAFAVY